MKHLHSIGLIALALNKPGAILMHAVFGKRFPRIYKRMVVRNIQPKPPVLNPFYTLVEVTSVPYTRPPQDHSLRVDKVTPAKLIKKPP